jgi:hypothetical protein
MLVDTLNNLDYHHQTLGNMDFPFEQDIFDGKITRTFSPDVDSDELKWHQDLKDRKITVIEDGGWLFQMEDSLPVKLSNAEQFSIPKFVWHRVIKGDGSLIVEIEEF